MLVTDANVIFHLHLQGEFTALAAAAYRRDPDWAAVPLWRCEFSAVLSKYLRAGHIDVPSAREHLDRALKLMMPGESWPDPHRPLELTREKRISAYDAYFVALAEQLRAPLLTEDKELLAKFPGLAVSLADFAAGRN